MPKIAKVVLSEVRDDIGPCRPIAFWSDCKTVRACSVDHQDKTRTISNLHLITKPSLTWFLKRDIVWHSHVPVLLFRGSQTVHIFSLLQFEEPFAWQGCMKRIETASINDTAGSESQLASRAGEGWGCDHAAFTVQASATLKLQHGQILSYPGACCGQ